MNIGQWLREQREKQRLSQVVLARAIGIDFTLVSKVENDPRFWTPFHTDRIVKALGVEEEFREFVNSMPAELPKEETATTPTAATSNQPCNCKACRQWARNKRQKANQERLKAIGLVK